MNLENLSDDQLLTQTSSAVDSENKITASVIKHLYEINRRKLYLKLGYSSLFEMLRSHYRYCEPTAQLRKNAVYLMQDVPEVIAKIESGAMPVTVAANIQSFLYAEKRLDREYSPEAKLELVETCTGKSVRAVQKEFVRRNPEMEKRESVRPITEDRVRVSHSISNQLEEKLQRIKLLWSHVDPNMSREQLLDRMADLTLEQIDPLIKAKRSEKRNEKLGVEHRESAKPIGKDRARDSQSIANKLEEKPQRSENIEPALESKAANTLKMKATFRAPEAKENRAAKASRHIDATANHEVRLRNGDHGCDFVSEVTKKRCGSKFQLQRDHIKPFSEGGLNSPENLRIYCGAHNRWTWKNRTTGSFV